MIRDLNIELKRFALYEDLKDLHKLVVPVVEEFTDRISLFSDEHKQMLEMIRRQDEVLSGKANKMDITKLHEVKLDKEQLAITRKVLTQET